MSRRPSCRNDPLMRHPRMHLLRGRRCLQAQNILASPPYHMADVLHFYGTPCQGPCAGVEGIRSKFPGSGRGRCPHRPAAPRPSVGAGPRPARGPVPFVGAAFGRPGVWGHSPHGGHRGQSPLYINWVAGGFRKLAGSERNCVFPLRLPSVYQNKAAKHWGARDCGFWGAEPCANVYQKSTMRTSAAQTSGFFAVLGKFLNLFKPVTGVVQPCHPVSGNVFLLLPEK